MRDVDEKPERTGADWPIGEGISVTRLPNDRFPMARVMGVGTLLDPLVAGQVVRVRLDEGRALAPSEVVSVDRVGPDVAIVATRNHRYEFRRIAGAPSQVGVFPVHDDFEPATPDRHGFDTQIVEIECWPEPEEADFVEGARILVVKEKDERIKELGAGILLCDLRKGEPLSMTIGAEVVSTSPVSAIRDVGPTRVEVRTGNSRYTLELTTGTAGGE